MKKILSLLIIMAMALSLLTGCAETPENVVVLQKDQEQLIETANSLEDSSATIASQTNAPETYQSSYSNGNFSVTVDATVTLPDADTAKIIRVTEHEITQEEVDAWTEYFFGDQTLYTESSLRQPTKEELQAQLLQLQKSLAELEAAGETPTGVLEETKESGETVVTGYSEAYEIQEAIDDLQESIAVVPEERTPVETTNELTKDEDGYAPAEFAVENDDKTGIRGMYVLSNTGFQEIYYMNHGDREYIQFSGHYPTYKDILLDIEDMSEEELANYTEYQALQTLPEPELNAEDAQKQAEEFMTACGFEDFALQEAQQVVIPPGGYLAHISIDHAIKGWDLLYQRVIDDIPIVHPGVLNACPDAGSPWIYESLHIIVNDDGIVDVDYKGPYDIGETLCENCKLMDFESVMEICDKMMRVKFEPESETYNSENYLHQYQITDIQFGYTRITESNEDYSGFLIPTWLFWGSQHYRITGRDGISRETTEELSRPLLVINAIDGSVINILDGY